MHPSPFLPGEFFKVLRFDEERNETKKQKRDLAIAS